MTTPTKDLPQGWRWASLSELLTSLETGKRPTGGVAGICEGIPSLSAEHMDDHGGFKLHTLRFVPREFFTGMSKGRIQKHDILVVKDGATTGKTAYVDDDFPISEAAVNEHVFLCRPNTQLVHSRYLFLWLWSPQGKRAIRAQYQGAAIGGINTRFASSVHLPLPPLPDQRRIAAILNDKLAIIARARSAAQAQLAAAQGIPAAYLRAVFNNAEAQCWPRAPLGQVSTVLAGITKGRKLSPGTEVLLVPYLRVANVQDAYLDLSEITYIEATEAEVERYALKRGDLLLTEGGDPDKLGRGTFWEKQIPSCIYQNHIFRVRIDAKRFLPAFLSHQISSAYGKAYFLANARQTTGIATINRTILSNFPVMIPPMPAQRRLVEALAERLEVADRTAEILHDQQQAIDAMPQALLRQAFSGEL